MSRIRVVAARLYAAFIHAQLFVMSCRSKLTKYLLLIPMMLLPKAVLADGDLADMVRNVGEGAKTAQSSSLTIAQFIVLAGCIVSIVIGALLVAGPEMMNRSQKQLGISTISIG